MVRDNLAAVHTVHCLDRLEDSCTVLAELLHHAQAAHEAILVVQGVDPDHQRDMRTVQVVNAEESRCEEAVHSEEVTQMVLHNVQEVQGMDIQTLQMDDDKLKVVRHMKQVEEAQHVDHSSSEKVVRWVLEAKELVRLANVAAVESFRVVVVVAHELVPLVVHILPEHPQAGQLKDIPLLVVVLPAQARRHPALFFEFEMVMQVVFSS